MAALPVAGPGSAAQERKFAKPHCDHVSFPCALIEFIFSLLFPLFPCPNVDFWLARLSQGHRGEFEPGKVQYSTKNQNFFDRLFLTLMLIYDSRPPVL